MIADYFNLGLFIALAVVNWALHFIVNHRKRKKAGLDYTLNGKTILSEFISFVIVLVISLAESLLVMFLISLF